MMVYWSGRVRLHSRTDSEVSSSDLHLHLWYVHPTLCRQVDGPIFLSGSRNDVLPVPFQVRKLQWPQSVYSNYCPNRRCSPGTPRVKTFVYKPLVTKVSIILWCGYTTWYLFLIGTVFFFLKELRLLLPDNQPCKCLQTRHSTQYTFVSTIQLGTTREGENHSFCDYEYCRRKRNHHRNF